MKTLLKACITIAIIIAVTIILFKIIAGAFGVISSLINTILAAIVMIALLVIIIWMFRFASKNK